MTMRLLEHMQAITTRGNSLISKSRRIWVNNLRDGQVKASSVNASSQSVDDSQRNTYRRLLRLDHPGVQLSCRSQLDIVPLMAAP
jgi:hypothetical protein